MAFDVKTAGCVGNGTTDDTVNFQNAINACISSGNPATGVRVPIQALYISPGTYRITAPLQFYSAYGLDVYGEGGASVIRPDFTGLAALDINGVKYSAFRDFWITGSGNEALTHAFFMYTDNSTSYGTTSSNVVSRIHIAGTKYVNGFQFGKTNLTTQCDQIDVYSCLATGSWAPGQNTYWQNGFAFGDGGWGNNLGHHGYGLSSALHANNLAVYASQVAVYGCNLGHGGVDIYAQTNGDFYLGGMRSESSGRLMWTAGGHSPGMITLENIDWHGGSLNSDGVWIEYGYGGTLRLNHVACWNTPRCPRILLNGVSPQQLIVQGLTVHDYTLEQMIQVTNPNFSTRIERPVETRSYISTGFTVVPSTGPNAGSVISCL